MAVSGSGDASEKNQDIEARRAIEDRYGAPDRDAARRDAVSNRDAGEPHHAARKGDGAKDRHLRDVATPRSRKFRQAAFVYLHVGLLYEFAVWVLWREGLLPSARGPAWLWLLLGAVITLAVFWGLWRWQNAWFARAIWALHALRLPALIAGAFFSEPAAGIPSGFYLTAIPVILINLWMLARAGWDL